MSEGFQRFFKNILHPDDGYKAEIIRVIVRYTKNAKKKYLYNKIFQFHLSVERS